MYCEHNVELLPEPSAVSQLSQGACPVDWAQRVVQTAGEANCGKSVMCQDGMMQLAAIIPDITTGKGQPEDLELLRELCGVIRQTPGCALSARAAACVLACLEHCAGEWEAHCRRKRCTQLVCPSYYNLYIDPALCDGCGACIQAAPQGAVEGGPGLVSVIREDGALKTEAFLSVCPKGAIRKYGAVRPRIPDSPTPVGAAAPARERQGRRRRGGPAGE